MFISFTNSFNVQNKNHRSLKKSKFELSLCIFLSPPSVPYPLVVSIQHLFLLLSVSILHFVEGDFHSLTLPPKNGFIPSAHSILFKLKTSVTRWLDYMFTPKKLVQQNTLRQFVLDKRKLFLLLVLLLQDSHKE